MCTIILPEKIIDRLRSIAESEGVSLEDYLLEAALMDVGPSVKAIEYADASMELIKAAKEELSKGDVRQAAEKAWV